MSSRGENKKQKTVAVEKIRFLKRKATEWTIRDRTGPHSKASAVPLGFLVRDMLEFANSKKEAKQILNAGHVLVNGVPRKDLNFALGLFDFIGFPDIRKNYRIVLDEKGRIKAVGAGENALPQKISKVLKKKVSKNGVIELTTNDGFVLRGAKEPVRVSDSLKISLPDKKIVSHFPFAVGMVALIIGGKHAGETGKITEVIAGSMHKPKLVKLQSRDAEFSTLEKYVCVLGDAGTAGQMNVEGFEK